MSDETTATVDPAQMTGLELLRWMGTQVNDRPSIGRLLGMEMREVHDLADRLGAREREVIRAHYGLGRPAQTLDQIGCSLGLTAERARQIEVGALEKLRAALSRPAVARRP